MKAMLLKKIVSLSEDSAPLKITDAPVPFPGPGEILIQVKSCGVCHTEMDEIEGRTPPPELPVIPGHQVVGVVEEAGSGSSRFKKGDRVGVAWIYSSCGECRYCRMDIPQKCLKLKKYGHTAFTEKNETIRTL